MNPSKTLLMRRRATSVLAVSAIQMIITVISKPVSPANASMLLFATQIFSKRLQHILKNTIIFSFDREAALSRTFSKPLGFEIRVNHGQCQITCPGQIPGHSFNATNPLSTDYSSVNKSLSGSLFQVYTMTKPVALLWLLVTIVESHSTHHLPPTTTDVVATCSATTRIYFGGSCTFPYQQSAETVTLTVPERTICLPQDKVVLLVPTSTYLFMDPAPNGEDHDFIRSRN
jgi:hypothetical protein